MTRGWWAKFILLVFITIVSVAYILPTVANIDVEKSKYPIKQKINLGLDLQGGLYLVLGIDFNRVYKDVVDRQGAGIPERMREKGIQIKSVKPADGGPADDPRVAIEFDPAQRDALYNALKKDYWTLRLAGERPGVFEMALSHDYRSEIQDRTLNQSIEVIRNRIDEFGVTEPSIVSQGVDRVVVELPGVREVDRAKDLIGQTAKLEFKMVHDSRMGKGGMDEPQVDALVKEIEKANGISYKEGQKFSEYVQKINGFAKGKIPEGDEISFERMQAYPGQPVTYVPFLLRSRADVTGDDLQDASVQIDPENQRPNVSFTLNPRGAASFEKLSGDNIGHRMAIVLDNIVHSAPVFQSKIPGGRGQITLGTGGGDALMKEAKDLAIVLRAGALPAQLEFLEQRVIGPSLGADSIKKGAMASLIGSLAVFLFVSFYYRVSGLVAVFSLILNVIFVLASLIGLDATLTLPGIAGIALTVGIAVDSNVVIYERIREELRAGKNIHGAVESGFQKAFRTILDANVTNAAAAIVLLLYGTGPIKGFAVSLLIGIVTTLFTAVFVCKLIFDAYLRYLENRGAKTISI